MQEAASKAIFESWATSGIEPEKPFEFLWTLKGFSAHSQLVRSPIFKGESKAAHLWRLKVDPKKTMDGQEHLGVYLVLQAFGDNLEEDPAKPRVLQARFQISLLDSDGRYGPTYGGPYSDLQEFRKANGWGSPNLISIADLTAPSSRLVDEDILRVHCRVWTMKKIRCETGRTFSVGRSSSRSKDKLCEELGEFLKSSQLTDCALTTDTQTFKAHKAVLAARSKVFAAMFSHNMMESTTNTVYIPDFDAQDIEIMLKYIYSGEVQDVSNHKASNLIQLAEKYDLAELKIECEHILAKNLTVDSAAEVLVIAHMYNANDLKKKVIGFINRNKNEVRNTAAFQKLVQANAALFMELYLSQ